MARVPIYRRLATPLHAARASVGGLWALSIVAVALALDHPLVLASVIAMLLLAGAGARVGGELARTLRATLLFGVGIVAVNVLISRQGLTVFARLGDLGPFGQGNLTLEALVYGAVIAAKVAAVILATALASLAVDPDELLSLVRRRSFRSAITASLALRMVPLLAADAARLAEAQRTRAPSEQDVAARARGRLLLLGAVVGSALDRAMDVAATLELRGFAVSEERAGPAPCTRNTRLARPWSRHDLAFLASALALIALAAAARLGGLASFHAYPQTRMPLDGGVALLCALLAAAALLPFCQRRGVAR